MTQKFNLKQFNNKFSMNKSQNQLVTYVRGIPTKLLKRTGIIDSNCIIPIHWSQIINHGTLTPIIHFNKRKEGGKQIYTYHHNRIEEVAQNDSIIVKMIDISLNDLNKKLDDGTVFNDSQKNAADKSQKRSTNNVFNNNFFF